MNNFFLKIFLLIRLPLSFSLASYCIPIFERFHEIAVSSRLLFASGARAQRLSHKRFNMKRGWDMSILNPFLERDSSENMQYNHAQNELLLCLSKRQVDSKVEDIWTPLLGSVQHQIARFLSDGYLEEASLEEKYDIKFRVAEVKQLLESHQIQAKGKKSDLIKKYVDTIPHDPASTLVADIRLYHLTKKGQSYIDAYVKQKESDRMSMETSALANLLKGDIVRAGACISLYESKQIFKRGTGIDWLKGMPVSYLQSAAYLVSYRYDELPLMASQRKSIGALLALSVLLGESYEQAGARLMRISNGEFSWAVFGNVLRTNPCCGYASTCDPDDPEAIATLYARMRISESHVYRDLEALASSHIGKGIRILPANGDHCLKCSGKHHFLWSEIHSLPKLPKQWGCQCTYAVWI